MSVTSRGGKTEKMDKLTRNKFFLKNQAINKNNFVSKMFYQKVPSNKGVDK